MCGGCGTRGRTAASIRPVWRVLKPGELAGTLHRARPAGEAARGVEDGSLAEDSKKFDLWFRLVQQPSAMVNKEGNADDCEQGVVRGFQCAVGCSSSIRVSRRIFSDTLLPAKYLPDVCWKCRGRHPVSRLLPTRPALARLSARNVSFQDGQCSAAWRMVACTGTIYNYARAWWLRSGVRSPDDCTVVRH